MNSYFLEFFIYSGTGFVFSRLLADVLVLLLLLHFIREVALPVIKNYRLALYLDRICGSERRHWLYGHLLKVSLFHLLFCSNFKAKSRLERGHCGMTPSYYVVFVHFSFFCFLRPLCPCRV